MDRRQFLRFAAGAFTVSSLGSALSGCNPTTGGNTAPDNDGNGTYRFPQGLCSGDPSSTSGVFWTRVVRADGTPGDIPVTLEISLAPMSSVASGFRLFKQIELVAKEQNDYVIHHKLMGLEPNTTYFYRFVAGGDANKYSGRFRTLPAETAEVNRVQFAVLNGVDWSYNHWSAMGEGALRRGSVLTNTFFLILLGGMTNSFVPKEGSVRSAESEHKALRLPDGLAVSDLGFAASSLADYFYLQQVYRSDERLQMLLGNYTLMPLFGDSDFSSDCWQAHETYTNANAEQRERLLAALAAWMRYMPLDWGDVSYDPSNGDFSRIKLHRNFRFGNLLNVVFSEQRLQRSDHAIREDEGHGPFGQKGPVGSRILPDPAELKAKSTNQQQMMGGEQLSWIKQQLQQPVVWKVLAGESPFVHLPIDFSGEPELDAALRKPMLMSADFWGGYKAQQAEIVDFVRQQNLDNVISFAAGGFFSASEIWADYSSIARNPVMLECTTAPFSSLTLSEEIASQLKQESDPRYAVLRSFFDGSFSLDEKLFEQLQAWVKKINTGTRGFALVYVLLGEMVIDLARVGELSNGQVQNVIAGTTRVTLKAGERKIKIEEF